MGFRSAAVTMVYNEDKFLPIWIDYYGKNLGFENLYIIDHGSNDGSTARIPGNVIKIPRDNFDDVQRVGFINKFHASLLTYFDCVLYTDCDEFLVPRPTRYNSLVTYLREQHHGNVVRAVGVDVMPNAMLLPPVNFASNILPQRPYGFITPWESKPLVTKVPTEWSPGFHNCNQPSILDEDLWLFHLKHCDLQRSLTRLNLTRSMKWSEQGAAFGHHQRSRDEDLIHLVQTVVNEQEDASLDNLPITSLLAEGGYSKLRRIPDMFLPCL
ncbi:glycosyltransferase family 2 protein [Acetobacter senegalensis]|uniref:glycosyltransferase family 2 protein n=1 Tax=Acetobacter senegalensis TaxID=446692 RepID=UPI001EDA2544|nr:glycosyltransferase family 2 protein [Acetobacter senegalensis]MCG4259333.1 glycosyltransferase family 2 protein [Acetobacter senegalensis]